MTRALTHIAAAPILVASLAATALAQRSVRIDFEDLDASAGPIDVSALAFYLYDRNIAPVGWQIGTALAVFDAPATWGGGIAPSNSHRNVLSQVAPAPPMGEDPPTPPHRFILVFREPVSRFEFVRPSIVGTPDTPFSHPAWTMDLFGEDLAAPLASRAEPRLTSTSLIEKNVVTVTSDGTPFRRVLFSSNPADASMPALAVDSIAMLIVPGPGALLALLALAALPPRRPRRARPSDTVPAC